LAKVMKPVQKQRSPFRVGNHAQGFADFSHHFVFGSGLFSELCIQGVYSSQYLNYQ
jgi:hypothetical protein